jgi:hypothetical protein
MKHQVKTWTALAAAPLLAAAFAMPMAVHAKELHNNGVPGVDMSVSSKDHQPPSNNGVPGVDVDVSSHDKGSSTNNGVPGVNADTKTLGDNQGTTPYAEKSNTKTFNGTTGTHARKADRN